jgi:hypothetical protein
MAPGRYSVSKVTDEGLVALSPASTDGGSRCVAPSEASTVSGEPPSAAMRAGDAPSSTMTLLISAQ